MFDIYVPQKRIIALDADGVLLDYNKAAANVWKNSFGAFPELKDPEAYHFRNVYAMDLTDKAIKDKYYETFSRMGWSDMPAMPGAVEACRMLHGMGYELHVVSSMPVAFASQRYENLLRLGMPISSVTATGRIEGTDNPKRAKLLELSPIAFVDDLLSNFGGVSDAMHCAFVLHWDSVDNPNRGHKPFLAASSHTSVLDFAMYWGAHFLHTQRTGTGSQEESGQAFA